MNNLVDAATGAITLSPHEAQALLVQVRGQLAAVPAGADVQGLEREIRQLEPMADPERAYDMSYYGVSP